MVGATKWKQVIDRCDVKMSNKSVGGLLESDEREAGAC